MHFIFKSWLQRRGRPHSGAAKWPSGSAPTPPKIPPPPPLQHDAGETVLPCGRGCVDRGWDSAEHKAWPFTFHPVLNLPGKTQEESKVVQMRASVNARRELKTASEREERNGKWGEGKRGGAARLLTFLRWELERFLCSRFGRQIAPKLSTLF